MGSLKPQWLLCLSKLKFYTQKAEKLCRYLDPISYVDSEYYIEKLMKLKKLRQYRLIMTKRSNSSKLRRCIRL